MSEVLVRATRRSRGGRKTAAEEGVSVHRRRGGMEEEGAAILALFVCKDHSDGVSTGEG